MPPDQVPPDAMHAFDEESFAEAIREPMASCEESTVGREHMLTENRRPDVRGGLRGYLEAIREHFRRGGER